MTPPTPPGPPSMHDSIDALLEEFARRHLAEGVLPDLDAFCATRPAAMRDELRRRCEQYVQNEMLLDGLGSATRPERRLGDLRILSEIGRGGMGVVYLAEQPKLRRRVAVKVLPPHLSLDARRVERFQREAQAAARLRHPGIVPILDVGEADGARYFTMEYVEGRSLQALLDARPYRRALDASLGVHNDLTPWQEVAEITADIADALHYAHDNDVIHRDVKPQNILVDVDGRIRVVDFGLAKDESLASMSLTGDMAGTPFYMSPEQIAGKRGDRADRRTDVYSLGVVLYELLTGKRPFSGSTTLKVMDKITRGDHRPTRSHNRKIPRDLDTICRKAMERDPARRFQSAAELADDLRRFLDGAPIQAAPPSVVRRLRGACRRHALPALVMIAVVAAGGIGAAAWWQQRRDDRRYTELIDDARSRLSVGELDEAMSLATEALGNRPRDPGALQTLRDVQERRDERLLAAARRGQRQAGVAAQSRAQADIRQALTSQQTAAARRAMADVALSPAIDETARRLTIESLRQIERDPGLALLLAAAAGDAAPGPLVNDALLLAIDACHETRLIARRPAPVVDVQFDRMRNTLLVVGRDGDAEVIEMSSGRIIATPSAGGSVWTAALSPNGTMVALGRFDGNVRLWRVQPLVEDFGELSVAAPGVRVPLAFRPNAVSTWHALSSLHDDLPHGDEYLLVATEGRLRTYGVPSLALVNDHEVDGVPWNLAIAPNEVDIAIGDDSGELNVYHANRGDRLHTVSAHDDAIVALDYDRDGRRIATASLDRTIRVHDLSDPDRDAAPPMSSGNIPASVRFDPTGVALLTGEAHNPFLSPAPARARLWTVASGEEMATIHAELGEVYGAEFSRDGTTIVTAAGDGTVREWRVNGVGSSGALMTPLPFSAAIDLSPTEPRVITLMNTLSGAAARCFESGMEEQSFGLPHDGPATCVAFSPNGKFAAIGLASGEITIVPVGISAASIQWQAHDAPTYLVQFNPAGDRLISSAYRSGASTVWDLDSLDPVCELVGDESPLQSATFSPDGTLVATSSGANRSTRLYDAATGRHVRTVAWTELDDYTNWPGPIDAAAFMPDGRRLILAEFDLRLREVAVETGEILRTFGEQESAILCVAVSPNGTRVATGAMDGTVRVFDATTGDRIFTMPSFPVPVSTVAFSHDGEKVLAHSMWLGLIREIPVDPLVTARRRLPRSFTPDELDRYEIGTAEERAAARDAQSPGPR